MGLFNAPGGTGAVGVTGAPGKDGIDKQPLVSGVTIKTVNGEDLLGAGNVVLGLLSFPFYTDVGLSPIVLVSGRLSFVKEDGTNTSIAMLV